MLIKVIQNLENFNFRWSENHKCENNLGWGIPKSLTILGREFPPPPNQNSPPT